jgi:hypothetical protein
MKTFKLYIFFFSQICVTTNLMAQTIFSKDGKYGIMDEKNTVIIKADYDSICVPTYYFVYGKGAVEPELNSDQKLQKRHLKLFIGVKANKYGYIIPPCQDHPEWTVSKTNYLSIQLKKLLFILESEDGYTFLTLDASSINTFGNAAIFSRSEFNKIQSYQHYDTKYDSIYPPGKQGSMTLLKDGKYGLFIYNKEIIPPSYDAPLILLNDSLIIASKDGKYGLLNNLELVIPFVYEKDRIQISRNHTFIELFNYGKIIKFITLKDYKEYTVLRDDTPVQYDTTWQYRITEFSYDSLVRNLCFVLGENLDKNKDNISPFLEKKYINSLDHHLIIYDTQKQSEIANFHKPNCHYLIQQNTGLIEEIEVVSTSQPKIIIRHYQSNTGKLAFEFEFLIKDEIGSCPEGISCPPSLESIPGGFQIIICTYYNKRRRARLSKVFGYIDGSTYHFYKKKRQFLKNTQK